METSFTAQEMNWFHSLVLFAMEYRYFEEYSEKRAVCALAFKKLGIDQEIQETFFKFTPLRD